VQAQAAAERAGDLEEAGVIEAVGARFEDVVLKDVGVDAREQRPAIGQEVAAVADVAAADAGDLGGAVEIVSSRKGKALPGGFQLETGLLGVGVDQIGADAEEDAAGQVGADSDAKGGEV
jgi:hypothetical protein